MSPSGTQRTMSFSNDNEFEWNDEYNEDDYLGGSITEEAVLGVM